MFFLYPQKKMKNDTSCCPHTEEYVFIAMLDIFKIAI